MFDLNVYTASDLTASSFKDEVAREFSAE